VHFVSAPHTSRHGEKEGRKSKGKKEEGGGGKRHGNGGGPVCACVNAPAEKKKKRKKEKGGGKRGEKRTPNHKPASHWDRDAALPRDHGRRRRPWKNKKELGWEKGLRYGRPNASSLSVPFLSWGTGKEGEGEKKGRLVRTQVPS